MTILELRKSLGLSVREFSDKFHLNVNTVRSWEGGWRTTPESYLYLIQRVIELENKNISEECAKDDSS